MIGRFQGVSMIVAYIRHRVNDFCKSRAFNSRVMAGILARVRTSTWLLDLRSEPRQPFALWYDVESEPKN